MKLISQLRVQSSALGTDSESKTGNDANIGSSASRILSEIALNESIRYSPGDAVEDWLNNLLCLDATVVPKFSSGCPLPDACDLYPLNIVTIIITTIVFMTQDVAVHPVSSHREVDRVG